MNLWWWAAAAVLCALTGLVMGRWFSRLPSPWWTIGWAIPFLLVLADVMAFRFPGMLFVPPFSLFLIGIRKFAALGFVTTLVLSTPMFRIAQRRNRMMIALLMIASVFYLSLWPLLAPMVDRGQLSHLQTKMDKDGICLQSTDYTCGPAAAVTALRKLHLPADEGQIAILSCTSFQEGTPIDMLAYGLQNQYGNQGLVTKCRVFKSISELKSAGLTLAVIKYRFLEDHWVTILDVTDSEVIFADPLTGLTRVSYGVFQKRWRFIGIVLQRQE